MKKLFNGIYKDKKVLITGHTGFKGSWLSLWLSEMGAEVVGYSKDIPTEPNHFKLLNNKNIISIVGNTLNIDKLQKTLEQYQPDIVFHMAAQTLVRKSYKEPLETLETNIMGAINILESCRKVGTVKAIVNITSDKCYKNQELERGYIETDPMGGYDTYSASKGCIELISDSYRRSFFNINNYKKKHTTLLANVRAGNVIGGGDWAQDRLIPDIIRSASKKETTIVRSPNSTRPWQHVLEPLSGYLQLGWKLLEGKKQFADDWNFGPNNDYSVPVKEVVTLSKKYWDDINFKIEENPNNAHEAKLLNLDSTKARTKLNWKSVWDKDKTFEKTIEWYKDYYLNNNLLSENDIKSYIEGAKKASLEWTKI